MHDAGVRSARRALACKKESQVAKKHNRSNRELRKPKKTSADRMIDVAPSSVTATFAKPVKGAGKSRS
jgi:hypothetical protein